MSIRSWVKRRKDGFTSRKIFETVSNLDQAKWEKSDEAEKILLIEEKEVSKWIEVVPSRVELNKLFWNKENKVSLKAFPEEELNEFLLNKF